MADDKEKPEPHPGPIGTSNPWEFIFVGGILVLFLAYAMMNLLGFGPVGSTTGFLNKFWYNFRQWFLTILPYLEILSFLASAFLVFGIVSTNKKLLKLKREMDKKYLPPADFALANRGAVHAPNPNTVRWKKVLEHLESKNPNDWKIAIIEADTILDEIVERMGYHGETLGERLKKIEKSDFNTLDNAWEAHKVRNAIAHEGSAFQLNEREARRVIALFQSVFEEFKYI